MDILTPEKAQETTIYAEFISKNGVEGKYYLHEQDPDKKSGVLVVCAGMEHLAGTMSI